MNRFFAGLGQRLSDPARVQRSSTEKSIGQCRCGQSIFFRNSQCLACHAPLGYEPQRGRIVSLSPGEFQDTWRIDGEFNGPLLRHCANLQTPAGCNWLLPYDGGAQLCVACGLNRTIPDLSVAGNDRRWHKLEIAKRRLVAQLLDLGLPVIAKSENEAMGLAFDFLASDAEERPMTGHANGLVTFNIEEADDERREQVRVQMHEPYRTLLGHFRHEVGHYYWDRLVAGSAWLEAFRYWFGDERADYGEALQYHYENGAPADWQTRFVSAYATMHPWEDWAETWAHYLHMMDTLDTALSLGMRAGDIELEFQPFTREALYDPNDPQADEFLLFINAWIELAAMLNELSRSMGQPDMYPFVLPAAVIAKLHFIHRVVTQGFS
ncbi:zinc-binding metallopeptidase family protein [Pseudomonas sp. LRF_L74]|uniref:zinc-binding metallopeptidase family protein n=1 Tax=Pseudomonas sp. LRF_L74 TaxID=3369422 RepID=UPI003F5FA790